jgi:hypothetical protein
MIKPSKLRYAILLRLEIVNRPGMLGGFIHGLDKTALC